MIRKGFNVYRYIMLHNETSLKTKDNKFVNFFIIQVTLDNSKFTGPSINFERSRVRVFKSPEISGSIDWF